jgi:uncharacterized protein (TIGR00369 family)
MVTDSNADLDGLERLRRGLSTVGTSVPFADLCHMSLVDAGRGWVTRSTHLPPWLARLADSAMPGPQSILADNALGNAMLTVLPAGRISVTTELRLDLVGATNIGDPVLVCEARVVEVTDDVGLSNGVLRDGSGTTVAVATMWSAIIDRPVAPVGAQVPAPPVHAARAATTIAEMFDIEESDAEPLSVVLRVPPRAELANSLGFVHGGAVSVLADYACATLLGRTVSGPVLRRLHHQIHYVRPTTMTGAVEYRARLLERSRRFATLECLVVDGQGATTARVSQLCALGREG